MNKTSVALIPARSGSKRVPGKNIRSLEGHPLLAYSITAALESDVFDSVICATDSEEYADIARFYGAEVPFLRPASISGDKSPDIDWIKLMLTSLADCGRAFDIFSILRPTSPFRTADTIRRAWADFLNNTTADSLRAIEKCQQHPGKMWVVQGNRMLPIMPFEVDSTPWHSSQYTSLPEIFTQNASLEIAWTETALNSNTIAGTAVIPFYTTGLEGFDINNPEDWFLAEYYLSKSIAKLPLIKHLPYNKQK